MNVYLVRDIDTKEHQGIFWANNRKELFWCVDEMENPYDFEFKPLQTSAIWFGGQVGTMGQDDEDNERLAWEGHTITVGQRLAEAIFLDKGRWSRFENPKG